MTRPGAPACQEAMKMQVIPRLAVFLRKIRGWLNPQVRPWMAVSAQKIAGGLPGDERNAAGLCEQCGLRPFVTEWAGNGWLLCMACCEARRCR